MLLIPAIDIRKGRCVRLFQGDFAQETRYDVDAVELAASYAAQGAPWLHVVDLDGAERGSPVSLPLVQRIVTGANLSVQLGGGIRTESDLETALRVVQRVVIGSLAVKEPETVARWLDTYGGEHLTLALDVRLDHGGVPRLTTHGWTEASQMSLWEAIERYAPAGLKHILCTDVARDGALTGPNVDLYAQIKARAPQIALQASGGVRGVADLERLAEIGIDAAISGKALLEGRLTAKEIEPFLRNA
ncbi:MAG: 1-(5-phosphoribosyl)-5-[(5-phosphoribosylamino)methylideneamino]imidazole-4-carboxamide isomerase [Gammaproteobacteria bacterium]|nr:1-(5-phosphoribosyl)-5-[(5-phosphoribosylamino)methylideneamino]imidazole-4-carboxamide isomerase [Gammaproteobacteria bacterium]MDH3506067.1 1-(5-phosphoribosyl)-5-[(5-phosphoribosylamino)methylideneamino]imidazole-4-carboxamide isomerase [Gammaproteobacteria bacterium]